MNLTWLEVKIFVREPMGVFGTVAIPVLMFLALGRIAGPGLTKAAMQPGGAVPTVLPVFASMMMALGAVSSLITIIAIYREGGILKRLRATPLSPLVILSAHVIVKLLLTALTVAILMATGRRYFPPGLEVPVVSYGLAVLFTTWALLAIGFLIASVVPTARFAQPVGGLVLYPMIALSGLFFPIEALPGWLRIVARALPLGYVVSLLDGIWRGEGWMAHLTDITALVLSFLVFAGLSTRVFRWE